MSAPLGALTATSPGQTDRVATIMSRLQTASADVPAGDPYAITVAEARKLTDEIKVDAGALWDKLARAYTEGVWAALRYESWDAYCAAEFKSLRLRLPMEERQDVVCSLREAGLSIRAIASGVGISDQTVQRDLKAGVVNHYTSGEEPTDPIDVEVVENHTAPRSNPSAAPATVTGSDGKKYRKFTPPTTPRPSQRGGFTSYLTPVRKALREVPEQVVQFERFADDEQFRVWLVEKDSRVKDVRREIGKAIEHLQRMDERVQRLTDSE